MISNMKVTSLLATALTVTSVAAHSWLECTNHDNSQMLGWMKGNSTLNPPVIIDPAMPWYSQYCHGWPRNKANPGNWIDESSNYVWNIAANSWNGGSYHPADTHACPPNQRTPTYQNGAPMSTAAAGSSIKLRFGGNGHARGFNVGGPQHNNSPGTVTVYWKGAPEQEITDISEFTPANALQSQGFADESFAYPADPNVLTPNQGLVDKGNWMTLNLPKNMASGRHMMAWVWYYNGAPQWSTCFDVTITGGGSGAVAAAPAPAAISTTPAAKPAATSAAPKVDTNTVGAVTNVVNTQNVQAAAPVPAAAVPAVAAPAPAVPAPAAPAPAAEPDTVVIVSVTAVVPVTTPEATVAAPAPAAASPSPAPATDSDGAVTVDYETGKPWVGEGHWKGHGNPNSKVVNEAIWAGRKRHARDFIAKLL